jgi:hypothetical protein
MSKDYLFDGAGPVDPDVAGLEHALRPLRYRPRRQKPQLAALAVAAVALICVGVTVIWFALPGPAPWSTETSSCSGCIWQAGTWLDTSTQAHARVDDRGQLQATEGTRLRRIAQDDGARLRLDAGRLDVQVDAPAGWLVVEVPGAEVIDLGCRYSLNVDDAGHGTIKVTSGSVALQGTTRTEVLQGAAAATWPDGRTGLPVRLDAHPELVLAVDRWDRRATREAGPMLDAATSRDAVTLWHLLDRQPSPASREPVLHRIEELLPLTLPVPRQAILDGDKEAMNVLLATLIGATW